MNARRYLPPMALALALAALVVPSAAGAYVFWNTGGGTIGRADNDGANVTQSLVGGVESGEPIAVDPTHLYFTTDEENAAAKSAVARTNLDGGEATLLPEGLLGQNGSGIEAVDAEHVYWADSSGIGRARLDGSSIEPEFIKVVGQFGGIAVYGGFVYWTYFEGGFGETIGRANLATKKVDPEFVKFATPEAAGPRAIAVDAQGIFWTMDPAFDGPYLGDIGHAGLLGGTPVLDEIPGANAEAASGLAIDGSDLYWFDFEEGFGTSLARAVVGGSGSSVNRHLVNHVGLGSLAVNSAGPPPPPSPPAIPAPPPPPAGNPPARTPLPALKLAKLKLNAKAGTASIAVTVTGPGKLALAGGGLIAAKKTVAKAGPVSLTVKPTKATRATLEKLGKKRVTAKITFTPAGGAPTTESKSLTLKLS